jgi:hypothetical protein
MGARGYLPSHYYCSDPRIVLFNREFLSPVHANQLQLKLPDDSAKQR